jgi:hypothetical protein
MAHHRRSRMMPTMPSGLFGSESTPNLRSSERQTVDSVDVAPPRTASSANSLVDHTATALPPFPPHLAAPTRSVNEQSALTNPSNLRQELLISPHVPSQTGKPVVAKTWRKLAEQVKKVFEFGRYRKKGKDKEHAARQTLQIGAPTNFEHRQTGSDRPLMAADGPIDPRPTTSGDDSGASRVRFADTVEYVADRPQVTAESARSPGGPLTSHPLVTVFEEAPPATPDDDDDDDDSDGKQLVIANYDDDSDSSSSSSDESRWHRYLASKNAGAQVKDTATQFEDYDAQFEH